MEKGLHVSEIKDPFLCLDAETLILEVKMPPTNKLNLTTTFAHINIYSIYNGPGDRGSIPGRVIPKTQKMVLDASLLNSALQGTHQG